jgi:alcohol dehydrogenase
MAVYHQETSCRWSAPDPVAIVQALTEGLGADVAIEAVGTPRTFELATELIRPGGHVADIGVHGNPATLHLETLWTRDVATTTGLVDTYSTPTLSRAMATHQLDAAHFYHPQRVLSVRRGVGTSASTRSGA